MIIAIIIANTLLRIHVPSFMDTGENLQGLIHWGGWGGQPPTITLQLHNFQPKLLPDTISDAEIFNSFLMVCPQTPQQEHAEQDVECGSHTLCELGQHCQTLTLNSDATAI